MANDLSVIKKFAAMLLYNLGLFQVYFLAGDMRGFVLEKKTRLSLDVSYDHEEPRRII